MGVVLVHGNPETAAVWDPLVAALQRDDLTCLSPPGFGAPVPHGWDATVTQYRDWLIGELEAIGSPVDLIGHDWGGAHAVSVAMARPDLLRSWVTDAIGIFDPDYVWHHMAQVWQTPGAGEDAIAQMAAQDPHQRAERLASLGVSLPVAEQLASAYDDAMGRCILALYRSAAQPAMADLGTQIGSAATRPGLAILATEDHFVGTEQMRRRTAQRAGATIATLDGLGHWWMLQDPHQAAITLTHFWSSRPD
jgi:pimeloyl-ACP methyl ester carboxylesterase